jgi:spore maturation protein CgeB
MRILYLAADFGTSRHRRLALERLGHDVERIDCIDIPYMKRPLVIAIWHLRGFGVSTITYFHMWMSLFRKRYEFCFVGQGESVGPALVRLLKRRCGVVACYNVDNPFVVRDGFRWKVFLRALPVYDFYCTIRPSTAEAAHVHGARKAISLFRTADEVVHRPRAWNAEDEKRFSSEVAFIGTWMPERGPFVEELLEAGVPVRIFGANWRKAPEFERIKGALAIDRFLGDEDYVRAIQYSKIVLGLLSVGNEDMHTGRSLEVPAIGSLFCGQRTREHLAMYIEGEEAVFWDDAAECARRCFELLAAPELITRISRAGHKRMMKSGHFNEELMRSIIDETLASV